ncbi:MAG TPA: SgcJ/EcaC family oxidoreductase [Thermoanaerobaculia bacterium]|nr:SgcJ/EcaC family oxidoreductase [Thermoanaerobaculia bacterium]
MKLARWTAFAVAAALSVRCLSAAAPSGASVVETQWLKAVKANDIEAILACYAPDAVLWGPGEAEARGTEAIRKIYAGILAGYVVRDASLANAQRRELGRYSVGWGNYTLTLAPKKGGPPVAMHGRFTDVVEKRGGKWLYVADHASADPEPAAKR